MTVPKSQIPQIVPIPILNWVITMGGSRKGANISVDDPDSQRHSAQRRYVLGEVTGWLDTDLKPCARKSAKYCQVRRWTYSANTNDIPEVFAVPIDKPPTYYSHTFKPAKGK